MARSADIAKALRDTAAGLEKYREVVKARVQRLIASREKRLEFDRNLAERQASRNKDG